MWWHSLRQWKKPRRNKEITESLPRSGSTLPKEKHTQWSYRDIAWWRPRSEICCKWFQIVRYEDDILLGFWCWLSFMPAGGYMRGILAPFVYCLSCCKCAWIHSFPAVVRPWMSSRCYNTTKRSMLSKQSILNNQSPMQAINFTKSTRLLTIISIHSHNYVISLSIQYQFTQWYLVRCYQLNSNLLSWSLKVDITENLQECVKFMKWNR